MRRGPKFHVHDAEFPLVWNWAYGKCCFQFDSLRDNSADFWASPFTPPISVFGHTFSPTLTAIVASHSCSRLASFRCIYYKSGSESVDLCDVRNIFDPHRLLNYDLSSLFTEFCAFYCHLCLDQLLRLSPPPTLDHLLPSHFRPQSVTFYWIKIYGDVWLLYMRELSIIRCHHHNHCQHSLA